jgi:SAM-dependent methyltransferase
MTMFAIEEARIRDAYVRRLPLRGRDSFFSPGHLYLMQDRERHVLELLRKLGRSELDNVRILDVGCGRGQWLRQFVTWGARPGNVTGVELLPDRVMEARSLCPAGVTIECASAADMPVADHSFDIVIQSMMFSAVLDAALRQRIASEMLRALAPGGVIIWYDFFRNNPANPDVRGVTAREVVRLFPGCTVRLQRVTLAPPLARVVAHASRHVCDLLALLPPFRTHYLGTIVPDDRAGRGRQRSTSSTLESVQ